LREEESCPGGFFSITLNPSSKDIERGLSLRLGTYLENPRRHNSAREFSKGIKILL
jgi:hypothetical protein